MSPILHSMYMGQGMSTSTQNVASFLSSVTMTSITNNQTSCQSTATVNQNITIADDPYAAATKCNAKCGTAPTPAPEYCYAVCKLLAQGAASSTFTAGTISQTAHVQLSSTCNVSDPTTNAVQNDVVNAITQKMAQTNDDVGTALKGIVSTISKSNDSTVNTTTVQNLVKSTFSISNLQTFVNAVSAQQSITADLGVTSATFNSITQDAATSAMTSMLASNSTINSASQAVTNSAAQTLEQTNEVLPGIQAGFASVLAGLGSLLASPLLIIGVVVVILVIIVLFLFK